MITVVDILDIIVNKIVGLDKIPDEKKERYLEIVVKAVTEAALKQASNRSNFEQLK